MHTRALIPADLPHLEAIYREMGDQYGFPDLLSPEFEETLVTVDDDGIPIMAVCARRTTEIFHLMKKGQGGTYDTPRWRWAIFVELHEKMRAILFSRHYSDCHAWLNEDLVMSWGFRKLCKKLGWRLLKRACFAVDLKRIEEVRHGTSG